MSGPLADRRRVCSEALGRIVLLGVVETIEPVATAEIRDRGFEEAVLDDGREDTETEEPSARVNAVLPSLSGAAVAQEQWQAQAQEQWQDQEQERPLEQEESSRGQATKACSKHCGN